MNHAAPLGGEIFQVFVKANVSEALLTYLSYHHSLSVRFWARTQCCHVRDMGAGSVGCPGGIADHDTFQTCASQPSSLLECEQETTLP